MSYDFSFDKKTAVLMAIGCIVTGVLLFLAGFIVGIDRTSGQAEAAAKQPPASGVQIKPAAQDMGQPPLPPLQKPSPEKRNQTSSPASAAEGSQTPASQAKTESTQATADSKAKGDEAKEQSGFSLQLGAFQAEDNALKLRDNMKSKGYPVFLFRALDADGHVWHTVRMGHYPDMKRASQAAASFSSKEQISAWVRPSNAF
jgi:cell division septation protein DedD